MRANARGQATVELALISIVFITVLIFGLHFAEVGWLSIKVQEAANSAVWDATAQKMHRTFTGDWKQYQDARDWAGARNSIRYEDLDGRATQENEPADLARKNFAQVFTVADRIDVDCTEARPEGVSPAEVKDALVMQPTIPLDAVIPWENTTMACHARATLRGHRIPQAFLQSDERGYFHAEHWTERDLPICSAGRFRQSDQKCVRAFTVALDDWGFSGPEERLECPLAPNGGGGCQNRGYYNIVKRGYERQMDHAGPGMGDHSSVELARFVLDNGAPPIPDENHFYMSFRGSESQYTEKLRRDHRHTGIWETTPWTGQRREGPREYHDARRGDCWLGHRCN